MLQQFYSALASFFFSLIIDPSSLQLLLNLLTQLIGATPGATGLTAAALTTKGSFYSTAGGTIVSNGILPLDTTDAGTTADLTLASNTITIATAGVYLVNYLYTPLDTSPENSVSPVQLVLNDVAVPGGNIFSNPTPPTGGIGSQPATGTKLIIVTAGSTLSLINSATGSITLSASPITSTQVTLIKVG